MTNIRAVAALCVLAVLLAGALAAQPDISVASSGTPNEAGTTTGTYTITATASPATTITINFQLTGTATFAVSGQDYTLSSGASAFSFDTSTGLGTIDMLDTETQVTITLTPIDDSTVEPVETAILTIQTGTNYNVGTPDNATLNITSDDVPSLSVAFTGSPSEAGPTTGTYTITASTNVLSDTTINFTMSGTAAVASGTDYNLSSTATLTYTTGPTGTIVMTTGTNTVTITLTPVDDAAVEGTETAILTLNTGTGYTVGAPSSATANIADNDSVSMSAGAGSDPSEAGPLTSTFTITASQNVPTNTTINFQMSGTATFGTTGQDYTLSSGATGFTFSTVTGAGSLQMDAGTNSVTITLTVINDASPEAAETAILTITTGTGYTVGAPASATLTISDNDSVAMTVAFTGSPSEAGPTTGTYTITASQNVPSNTTINFTMSGTAAVASGTDYNLSSAATLTYTTGPTGTIVMASGTNSVTITLTPVDDAAIEGTETAILTINAGTGYTVGSPSSATANIADNDAAPAAASLSASPSNPGAQNATPGSTPTALVFRLVETGGGTAFVVTSVTVTVATSGNAGNAAISRIASVSLRRGGTLLGTITNGGTGWSVAGDNVTLSYTGLSSSVSAGGTADFTVNITLTGASVPTPNPRYIASVTTSGVNGGTAVSGSTATGGQITLADVAPGDPFADVEDSGSCDLATRGGPAWPLALVAAMLALGGLRRRRFGRGA
ncbi:MAG: hypothetical protein HS108_03560 [Planctomycetes bacterium]|nr:hypothetical protein [Planctomycetota bacterium]